MGTLWLRKHDNMTTVEWVHTTEEKVEEYLMHYFYIAQRAIT